MIATSRGVEGGGRRAPGGPTDGVQATLIRPCMPTPPHCAAPRCPPMLWTGPHSSLCQPGVRGAGTREQRVLELSPTFPPGPAGLLPALPLHAEGPCAAEPLYAPSSPCSPPAGGHAHRRYARRWYSEGILECSS
jgi:hypothetical protein